MIGHGKLQCHTTSNTYIAIVMARRAMIKCC